MNKYFNRRDFLKLSSLLPLGITTQNLLTNRSLFRVINKQNVLVIVFDALSALNISFYGYGRETTPNLAKLIDKAHVYHNHYAGGNYTTAGTATLLTGTLPWTHRAINPGSQVADALASHNIFKAFQGYYRTAFTHNGFANKFLKQFSDSIEEWIPSQNLFLESYDGLLHTLFYKDDDAATVAWARNIEIEQGSSYSLFISSLYSYLRKKRVENFKVDYPRGIPSTSNFTDTYFILDDAVDWIKNRVPSLPEPFLGYFHFLPPHAPYRTSRQFYGHFADDGFKPLEKPVDLFTNNNSNKGLPERRAEYDEFILYADDAFGKLFSSLESSGVLDNTWVIFTSDHGEMNERGISGHSGATLYQPLIRIPLLIFEPGQKTGSNIFSQTSAIDLLPTLLHLVDLKTPDWTEGTILPPFASAPIDPNRNLYAVQAYYNEKYAPLTQATTTLIKGQYKLIYYFGYPKTPQKEFIQLFDVESDPEELIDLSTSKPEIANQLLAELKAKLAEVNKPYE